MLLYTKNQYNHISMTKMASINATELTQQLETISRLLDKTHKCDKALKQPATWLAILIAMIIVAFFGLMVIPNFQHACAIREALLAEKNEEVVNWLLRQKHEVRGGFGMSWAGLSVTGEIEKEFLRTKGSLWRFEEGGKRVFLDPDEST